MYRFASKTRDQKLFIILTPIVKKTKINLSKIDTVILAGGLGTRLQPVLKDKPKCLAPINGKPFIDILLDNCINQGLRRFILCVGYLKEQVIKHLSNRNDCKIIFSKEDESLCSGGGNQLRQPYLRKLLGDTYQNYPKVNHIHFHGFYIGNFPSLEDEKILKLCEILNSVD